MKKTVAASITCFALLASAAPASAQEETSPMASANKGLLRDGTLYARLLHVPPFVIGEVSPGPRPAILPALYVSFVGLEALDGYSTSRGLARGATESNPLVRWAVDNPTTLWAIKGATAVGSIYVAERLWRRHHRVQAVTLMVVSNAIIGAVAARNLSAVNASR